MGQSRYTVRHEENPPHHILGCSDARQTETSIKKDFLLAQAHPARGGKIQKEKYSRNSQTFGTRTVLPVAASIGSHDSNGKEKKSSNLISWLGIR